MHTVRNLLVVALLPLFSGCLPIPAMRQQGLITQGESRPLFTSCDGTKRQILLPRRYQEEAQEELVRQLQTSGVLFADLYGYSAGWKGSLFEVGWIERLEYSPDACSDPDFERTVLHAFGHEPGWDLRLVDKRMLIERPGQTPIDVPYLEDWHTPNRAPYSAEANGQKIELHFIDGNCVDRTTRATYNKTVQLRIGNEVLQGCAYHGGPYY